MARRKFKRRRTLIMMMCGSLIGVCAPAVAAAPALSASPTPIYLDTHHSFQERAADLVSRMTLQEKVRQLSTNSGPAIPRLGVQQYTYWSEGQHGINTLGANTNHGSVTGGVHATSFPTNFASSMSWDPSLIYQETTAIADEARGFLDKSLWGTGQNNIGPSKSNYGSLTYWAPTVNIDRDPRWGRTDEAFGEDPYLVSQMAGAFVNGYQGNTPDGKSTTGYLKVASTAKHYALNNVEQDRTGISSNIDDRTLREYYTAQFKSLIERAHVSGLMTSYNAINQTPAVADTYTVNQLAQRTYGFNGYITSDCGAIGTTWQKFSGGHDWAPPGWTTDHKSNPTWTNTTTGAKVSGQGGGQAYALRAGTALNCAGNENGIQYIQDAINAGALSEGVIDTALIRVFTVRMATGEFDPPSKVAYTKIKKNQIQSAGHQALAEKVAANSLVLLKNDNVTGTNKPLLPVAASKLNKVVILGDQANTVNLGNYSGEPALQVSAVKGITSLVKAANPKATVVFDDAKTSTTATTPAVLSSQTQADIKSADLVIVFVGTDHGIADEGKDRTTIAMPGNYHSLIDQTTALGNDKLALVIQSGGPVKIDDVQSKFPAIVFSGFNGESQGSALAAVLSGKQNPSGHLNFTWYSDDSQLPAMSNYSITAAGTGGIGRTYQYFTETPTYPFGYGKSYTGFAFSHVAADKKAVTADGSVKAGFDVTNTGTTAGATVAQLYAGTAFTVAGQELPKRRLVGFQKTAVLRPGQTQHISLTVKAADLGFWDATNMKTVVYSGGYQFEVGGDSSTIAGTATVEVSGTLTPKVQYVTVQPETTVYGVGQTLDLTGKNQWIKDDTNPAYEQRNRNVTADHVVEAVNNDQSFVDLSHAQVSYASSNTNVATVSKNGLVTAVADGVATITVTVNGVRGRMPIVVQHAFSLTPPSVVVPGTAATATTTLVNGATKALHNVKVVLTAPSGWSVKATSPSSFATVPGGQSAKTTWAVTAPAGTKPGTYQLLARSTYTGGKAETAADTSVPFTSLTQALNNPGISDDAAPTAGNIDGGGLSFSAQALAAAGLTPGASITHNGLTFTWPNVPAGTADNVVAGGQTFALSGTGTKLGFLGVGAYGAASGSGLITYTDGTTQPFAIGLADWWANSPEAFGDILASFSYLNNPSGKQNTKVSMYYTAVSLQPNKTVRFVTLPNVSQGVANGTTSMHIFAAAIGNGFDPPQVVSLRAHANGKLVTADLNNKAVLIANRTAIGQWEQFDEFDLGNGTVALRAHANNNYVTADNGGAAPLIANGTSIGVPQTFTLIHNADGSVSLRAKVNNAYVTAPNGGNDPLIASQTAIGPSEEFDIS